MPKLKEDVINVKAVDTAFLKKEELLSLYNQQKHTIAHMQDAIEDLRKQLGKAADDNLAMQKDYNRYSERVISVIKRMEDNYKTKISTLFTMVTGMQTLIAEPDYGFKDTEDAPDAV